MAELPRNAAYLDTAATALTTPAAARAANAWRRAGNPGAAHAAAEAARRRVLDPLRAELLAAVGAAASPRGSDGAPRYRCIFTSGGSEANSAVLAGFARACARARRAALRAGRPVCGGTGGLPHIITAATEHGSLLAAARQLEEDGLAEVTVLEPETSGPLLGLVRPEAVRAAVRPGCTCLVALMAVNNETGVVAPVGAYAAAARAGGAAFFCDAVQALGKATLRLRDWGVDAAGFSFHKIGAPPGAGAIVVREGLALVPIVAGSQEGGARGGTENLPALAGALAALRETFRVPAAGRRRALEERRRALRAAFAAAPAPPRPPGLRGLAARARDFLFPGRAAARGGAGLCPVALDEYRAARDAAAAAGFPERELRGGGAPPPRRRGGAGNFRGWAVFVEPPPGGAAVQPGVALVGIVAGADRVRADVGGSGGRSPGAVCGGLLRRALERRGVVVSVGSACNAQKNEADAGGQGGSAPSGSQVAQALDLPPEVARGLIRISFGPETPVRDLRRAGAAVGAALDADSVWVGPKK